MSGKLGATLAVCLASSVIVAQPLEPPRNLLRNSHFWLSTNGEVPDWWGTGIPERIREWRGCIALEESSPIQGTRALRLFNPQAGTRFSLQSFAYALPSGTPYTFSVYLRAGREDFPVTLSIGYDQSTTVRVSTQWQRYTFTATPQRGHWAQGRLIVSIAFTQEGTLWVAAPQLEAGESATDYTPLYRDGAFLPSRSQPFRAIVQLNFYTTEPTFRLWCESNLPKPVTVRCRIANLEVSPVSANSLAPGERKFLPFSLDKVPTGAHTLTVEAVDEQGNAVATVTDALTKLPPPENVGAVVQIDRVRRFLVINGKPTILFAQGLHDNPETWWLDEIAAHGFNAAIPMVSTDPKTWESARQFLDEMQNRKLWAIVWLRPFRRKTAQEIADGIAKTISALKDHPAIAVWYLLDEPEDWWAQGGRKEEELLTVYQNAKQADPYRPAQLNWYAWMDGKGGYGSLQASDFGSLDHYPFGRVENPFARLADFLWRMNRDCRPLGKPVAFWQQMYGYDDAVREPTAEEARTHTWLTLVTGGRLVYWFIYKPMGQRFWATMPQIAKEVSRLEALLTKEDATELAVGREGNVHYALWRIGGQDILLVVNAGYTFARVPIFVRWLLRREVKRGRWMLGDKGIVVRGGVAWTQLPPLAGGAFQLE
ncbi:MAG: hypothetical protein C4295_10900 [Candidatus Fervidibacterota bacterium]